jgi:hypothetical protein
MFVHGIRLVLRELHGCTASVGMDRGWRARLGLFSRRRNARYRRDASGLAGRIAITILKLNTAIVAVERITIPATIEDWSHIGG